MTLKRNKENKKLSFEHDVSQKAPTLAGTDVKISLQM